MKEILFCIDLALVTELLSILEDQFFLPVTNVLYIETSITRSGPRYRVSLNIIKLNTES